MDPRTVISIQPRSAEREKVVNSSREYKGARSERPSCWKPPFGDVNERVPMEVVLRVAAV